MANQVYDAGVLAKLMSNLLTSDQLAQVAKLAPGGPVPAFCRQVLSNYEAQPAVWSSAIELVKKRQATLTGS